MGRSPRDVEFSAWAETIGQQEVGCVPIQPAKPVSHKVLDAIVPLRARLFWHRTDTEVPRFSPQVRPQRILLIRASFPAS
jgi:hypothetical protein